MTPRITLRACTLTVALSAALLGQAATASDQIAGPLHVPATDAMQHGAQRFIVKYRQDSTSARDRSLAAPAAAAALQRSLPARMQTATVRALRRTAGQADVLLVSRPLDDQESERFLQQLRADPQVEYAQVDRLMHPLDTMPNDPRLSTHQWDMLNTLGGIYGPKAWDDSTGEGVVVAVLDTGILPHADLLANLVPGYDFISEHGQTEGLPDIAVDGDGRDPDPTDPGDWNDTPTCSRRASSWHGTHVAGTVAAVANNGRGVVGAAYGAKVQPVRVLGRCGGLTSDIADAIVWASGGHVEGVPDNATPADVINLSLGGGGRCANDPAMQQAIDSARSRGTAVVVAAGNNGGDAAQYSPASCRGAITVAATTALGGAASYSNFGAPVALAAPGGDINSSIPVTQGAIWSTGDGGDTTANNDNALIGMVGTSMAAPHVAGIVALMQSAAVSSGGAALTPDAVHDLLQQSVRAFPAPPAVGRPIGAGIADAYRAVQLALGKPLPEVPKLALQNGVLLPRQQGIAGASIVYEIEVPTGASTLNLRTMGGTGDVSLYASAGVVPTAEDAQFSSRRAGNAETIVVSRPTPGTWYLRVAGETPYQEVSVLGLVR